MTQKKEAGSREQCVGTEKKKEAQGHTGRKGKEDRIGRGEERGSSQVRRGVAKAKEIRLLCKNEKKLR